VAALSVVGATRAVGVLLCVLSFFFREAELLVFFLAEAMDALSPAAEDFGGDLLLDPPLFLDFCMALDVADAGVMGAVGAVGLTGNAGVGALIVACNYG